jgi:hypothetical protein
VVASKAVVVVTAGYGKVNVLLHVAAAVEQRPGGLPFTVATAAASSAEVMEIVREFGSDPDGDFSPAALHLGVEDMLASLADKGRTDVRVVYPVLS